MVKLSRAFLSLAIVILICTNAFGSTAYTNYNVQLVGANGVTVVRFDDNQVTPNCGSATQDGCVNQTTSSGDPDAAIKLPNPYYVKIDQNMGIQITISANQNVLNTPYVQNNYVKSFVTSPEQSEIEAQAKNYSVTPESLKFAIRGNLIVRYNHVEYPLNLIIAMEESDTYNRWWAACDNGEGTNSMPPLDNSKETGIGMKCLFSDPNTGAQRYFYIGYYGSDPGEVGTNNLFGVLPGEEIKPPTTVKLKLVNNLNNQIHFAGKSLEGGYSRVLLNYPAYHSVNQVIDPEMNPDSLCSLTIQNKTAFLSATNYDDPIPCKISSSGNGDNLEYTLTINPVE
ncbi:MAG: hypothetical protein AAGA27_06440 [Pseudomonadota bacterium]